MAKQVINSFNGGEVSPNTYARFDSELYNKSCLKLENFIPMQAGGVERRPGTKYLSDLESNKSVAYSFVFNNSNTYVLVFSNTELKIYNKDGVIREILGAPYLEAELYDLKLTQSADVVFITHPNHAVQQLSRLSDNEFTLLKLSYSFPPTLDLNKDLTFSISEPLKSETITHVQITNDGVKAVFTVASHSFEVGSKVNVINVSVSASNSFLKTNGTWEVTATTPTAITCTIFDDSLDNATNSAVDDNSATIREFRNSIPANTTITLTASQDFFTTDDEGSEFVLRQKRDNANSLVDSKNMYPLSNISKSTASSFIARNGYSDALNASLSNWSIETFGTWRGKVIIQRSLDNGVTYEDYIVIGDTSGIIKDPEGSTDITGVSAKNFTFASTEPEPVNSLLRVVTSFYERNYENIILDQNFNFNLKADSPYILAPCTIITRSSATIATAVLNSPLIDAVNDYESTTGNCKWVTGKKYLKHDKVKFSGKLTELTGNHLELFKSGDSSTVALTGVRGSCWDADNDRLLVLVDESGTSKVYFFSSSVLAHNASQITGSRIASSVITLNTGSVDSLGRYDPSDIAWYDGHIYAWGTRVTQGNHMNSHVGEVMNHKILGKFNVDGSYDGFVAGADEKSHNGLKGVNQTFGLGFDGAHFYAAYSYFEGANIADIVYRLKIRKYNISGNKIGEYTKSTLSISGDVNSGAYQQGSSSPNFNWNKQYLDITAKEGLLYILSDDDDEINIYDTSCNYITQGIDLGADDYRGIGYNPQTKSFYTVENDGFAQAYTVADTVTSYYQCQVEHDSSSFANELSLGYWTERFPNKIEFFESAFNKKQGFPHSIAIYESRLCFGGTNNKPNTLWLSKSNDLNNFQTGTIATDSMRLTINSNTIDEIRWLCPSSSLIIGTSSNEWSLGSGSDQLAVTPTQFNIKRKSNYGSNKIQGTLVNASVLFAMRQGTKLREWIDQNTRGVFLASDLTSLADHITEGGILQLAVQTQPETIVWAVRNDGTLLGLTYEKETETFGWHRHTFLGATVESVSVLPTSTSEDCVYLILKKTDNQRCLIKMDNRNWGSTYTTEYNGLDNYTTASKTFTSGSSSFLPGELDQFDNDTVKVKVNGVLQTGTYIVNNDGSLSLSLIKDASGNTLTDGTYTVVVGQTYISTLAPLYTGIQYSGGTTRGNKKSIQTAWIRFKDTLSAKVGQTETDIEPVNFASTSVLNNEEAQVWLSNANEFLQTIYVIQDEPQPCSVLSMIPELGGSNA